MYDVPTTERGVISNQVKFEAKNVQVFYGDTHAIKDVDVEIADKTVTAFIGPSGCGKSTFLRCLNRMNDTIDICRVEGKISLDGDDIYDKRVDPVQLRAKVGMVFQKPNPFPKSIYDNVAYGPRIHGLAKNKAELDDLVEKSLRRGAIWDEVKDRLDSPGTGLSGGQQQRLCIARAVATEPEVLLMDEPFGALDALTRSHMQDSLMEIQAELNNTVIMITHDVDEAVLLSDRIVMMTNGPAATIGEILEVDIERPRDRIALASDPHYNDLRSAVLKFLYDKQRQVEDISAARPTDSGKLTTEPAKKSREVA